MIFASNLAIYQIGQPGQGQDGDRPPRLVGGDIEVPHEWDQQNAKEAEQIGDGKDFLLDSCCMIAPFSLPGDGYSSLPTLTLHYKNRKMLLRGRRVRSSARLVWGGNRTFLNFVILCIAKLCHRRRKYNPGAGNARVLLAKPQCGWYNNPNRCPGQARYRRKLRRRPRRSAKRVLSMGESMFILDVW